VFHLFSFQLSQMLVVNRIRERYIFFVPTIVAGFVPANQQNRRAAGIECVKNSIRSSLRFTHVCMPRHLDGGRVRHFQRWPNLLQKTDGEVDALLLESIETIPPPAEFIGELDLPRHALNMSQTTLCCQEHIMDRHTQEGEASGIDASRAGSGRALISPGVAEPGR